MPDTLRYSCIEFFLVCFKMLRCFSFHSNALVVFAEHHGVSSHVVVTWRGRRVGLVDLERRSRTNQRARMVGRHDQRYRRNVSTSYPFIWLAYTYTCTYWPNCSFAVCFSNCYIKLFVISLVVSSDEEGEELHRRDFRLRTLTTANTIEWTETEVDVLVCTHRLVSSWLLR